MLNSAVPIACDLGALSTPERQRRSALAARIRKRVIASTESETGFRLQLPTDDASFTEVLELISLERRCCPFLEMRLVFSPGNGPVYFDVGGGPDVKAFLATSGVLGCSR